MSIVHSNTYEGRYLQLEVWEISSDAAANTSLVGWALRSVGGYSSYYYIADTTVTLGDQVVYAYDAPVWDTNWAAKTFPVKTGQVEGQLTVRHHADGRKTLNFSLSTRVYIAAAPAVFSGSLALTDLPPVQQIPLQAADMVLGEDCLVTWTPASPTLYYRLQFLVGSKFQAVSGLYPNRTTAYTFRGLTLSPELAQGIPNAPSGEMTVTLSAHSDFACTEDTQVGQSIRAQCTVTVPQTQDFLPELALELTPGGGLPEAFAGLFIQGKTPICASLPARGRQGAGIQTYRLSTTGAAVSGGTGPLELGSPSQYGTLPVTAGVQDTRGMEATVTQSIQVLPYARPKIQSLTGASPAFRCGPEGSPSDSGSFLRIQARRSYSPLLVEGTAKNTCQIRLRWKAESDTLWSDWTVLLPGSDPSDQVDTGPLLGNLLPGISYTVQLQALDDLGEAALTTQTISTQRVYCHRHGALGSFAFGKLAEEADTFDIAPDKQLLLRGGLRLGPEAALTVLNIAHPVGSVLEMATPGNPGDTLGGAWSALPTPTEGTHRWQRLE